jgi:hypothetical protein
MKRPKPKVDLWGELFPMLSENELAELRIRDNDSAKQKAKRGKRHLGSRKPEQKAREINASDGLRRGYPAIRNGKEVPGSHRCADRPRAAAERKANQRGRRGHAEARRPSASLLRAAAAQLKVA